MKKTICQKLIPALAIIVTCACHVFSAPVPADSADSAVVRKILDKIGWEKKTVNEVITFQGSAQEQPITAGSRVTYLNLSWKNGDVPQILSLPAEIGLLPELTVLIVSNNLLTGVPSQVANLRKLTFLDISRNNIISLGLSIARLSNLQVLDASHNHIVEISDSIFQLKSLKIFTLTDNLLYGIFPAAVGKLTGVQSLRLDSNMLSGLPSSIIDLNNVVIDIRYNKICNVPEAGIEQWLASHQNAVEWQNSQNCDSMSGPGAINQWVALDEQTGVFAEFSSHHDFSNAGLAVQSSDLDEIYGYLLGGGNVLCAENIQAVNITPGKEPSALIRVVFPYTELDLSSHDPLLLSIYFVDKNAGCISPVKSMLDTVNKTIEATVPQFGLYTLLYDYEYRPTVETWSTAQNATERSVRNNNALDLIRKNNEVYANVSLLEKTSLTIELYSVNGRLVGSVASGVFEKGSHLFSVNRNFTGTSAQPYLVMLKANNVKCARLVTRL